MSETPIDRRKITPSVPLSVDHDQLDSMSDPPIVIGFTGTRSGMSESQWWSFRKLLNESSTSTTFVHGDCVGADSEAHDLAKSLDFYVIIYPCTLTTKRAFKKGDEEALPIPPLERNKRIVDRCDVLIAAPLTTDHEVRRSGTWATIRYARKVGKPIIILER